MADTEIVSPEEQKASQSPYQNVRTNGRAFNSANWRMKSENSSPQASPSSTRTNTSRTAFARPGPHVPQAISEGRRLYVGNMPYTAKTEDVEALFTAAEFPIERIDIAVDPFTGRNPSYCFVDLQTKEHAERAMVELDGRDMLGRPVKIKPGVAKSAERAAEQPRTPFAMSRWRERPEGSPTSSPTSFAKVNHDSSQRVYVGGLPRLTEPESVQSNMRTFFQGYNVENVSKVFTPHPAKRFEPGDHYYLFVDLSSVEEAQRAMDTLNGQQGPWGGPLRIQRARGTTNNKPEGTSSPAEAEDRPL
ncbi:putative ribonucleoprotein [Penicillium brasilianum]|uniref:Putative ribonucleoprotein n=1 Tax=Penicillium brasilianum TaxID=104259 RepID=A0A1S9RRL8_PENBI|nr:putative ribonucleoprotein [Penicillium brasilianum]